MEFSGTPVGCARRWSLLSGADVSPPAQSLSSVSLQQQQLCTTSLPALSHSSVSLPQKPFFSLCTMITSTISKVYFSFCSEKTLSSVFVWPIFIPNLWWYAWWSENCNVVTNCYYVVCCMKISHGKQEEKYKIIYLLYGAIFMKL